jgi:hypothetical protein
MNRRIDGKRYDTESATLIAETKSHGFSTTDFNYYEVYLYRKATGEYFLHGIGNAKSPYASKIGQSGWESGEKIIPLSITQAQKWAEENLSGDECDKIFGAVEEDKFQVSLWLLADEKEQAAKLGVTHAEIYRAGIRALTE